MTIKKITGNDPNRQYYEITRVHTGKKEIVSVHNKNAEKYEALRNKYEAQYIDKNGKRTNLSQKFKSFTAIGSILGTITGAVLGQLLRKTTLQKAFIIPVSGIIGGLLGGDIATHNIDRMSITTLRMERTEKSD